MNILIIAPHPDDEVLGCGGTIAKHATEKDDVYLCIATKAWPPEWPEEEVLKRKQEAQSAAGVLGIKKVYFLDFPTVKLDTVPQKELNDALARVVNDVKPEVVYIPHGGGVNKDHRIIFEACMVALRPKPKANVKKILTYETLSETGWSAPSKENAFIPNVYIDISQTLDTKLKAMSEYKLELKEFPHPRSLEAISDYARTRGSNIGVKAAEAFILIREIRH